MVSFTSVRASQQAGKSHTICDLSISRSRQYLLCAIWIRGDVRACIPIKSSAHSKRKSEKLAIARLDSFGWRKRTLNADYGATMRDEVVSGRCRYFSA
jgi:hypothetical protein